MGLSLRAYDPIECFEIIFKKNVLHPDMGIAGIESAWSDV